MVGGGGGVGGMSVIKLKKIGCCLSLSLGVVPSSYEKLPLWYVTIIFYPHIACRFRQNSQSRVTKVPMLPVGYKMSPCHPVTLKKKDGHVALSI